MRNIKEISTEELTHDYTEIMEDLMMCMLAITLGATIYSEGKSITQRANDNLAMAMKIRSELMRREDPIGAALENVEPMYG